VFYLKSFPHVSKKGASMTAVLLQLYAFNKPFKILVLFEMFPSREQKGAKIQPLKPLKPLSASTTA